MQKDYFGKSLLIVTLATVGATYLYAWTGAQSNPPTGNISLPINSSVLPQTKSGDFTLGAGTKLTAPSFCIGASCITSWPTPVVNNNTYPQTAGDNMGDQVARGALNMNGNWFYSGHFYHTSGYYFYLPGPYSPWYGASSPGDGKVLTSDPGGYAYWKTPTIPQGTPSGEVSFFNLSSCPSGWLPADGTSASPDLRGEFIRGLDNGKGLDSGRVLGSTQVDSLKDHEHIKNTYYTAVGTTGGAVGIVNGSWASSGSTQFNSGFIRGVDGGITETRPKNVALLACVKS